MHSEKLVTPKEPQPIAVQLAHKGSMQGVTTTSLLTRPVRSQHEEDGEAAR